MGQYDRQKATAARLIEKYGQTVTWQIRRPSGANPAAPSGGSVTPKTVKMVFLTPKLNSLAKALSVLSGTEIQTGGYTGLMAPVDFEPNLLDTVLRGTEVLTILRENGIDKLDPNGEGAILWYVRFVR